MAQTGLASGTGLGTTVNPAFIDDVASSRTCGAGPTLGSNPPYQPNIGINVLLRTTVGNSTQIFVGSDAPGTQQLIRTSTTRGGTATCVTCGNWVQLPYHTTATRLNDICLENPNFARVSQTNLASGTGLQTTVIPPERPDDVASSRTCGAPPTLGSNPPVQMGKPVNIVLKSSVTGDVLWSPAHF